MTVVHFNGANISHAKFIGVIARFNQATGYASQDKLGGLCKEGHPA